MTTQKQARERLGSITKALIAYRGWSAKTIGRRYLPGRPPLSERVLYRIIAAEDEHLDEDKLISLSGMLSLPGDTMSLVYAGDTAGVKRLVFPGDDGPSVQQFVLDRMDPPAPRARKRAAGH